MGRTRTPQPRSAGRDEGAHPSERLYVRLDGDPLYTPETSVPVGTMVELPVSRALRTHVAHVTAYREAVPEGFEVHERVLPDGAARIMFNLDDSVSAGGAVGPNVVVAGARILERTGEVMRVGDLAREYDFIDVDGRQVPPFALAPT